MNLIVLSLIELLLGHGAGRHRAMKAAIAAFLGAAGSAVFFLTLNSRIVFMAAGAFIVVPFMVIAAFGFGSGGFGLLLRRIVLGWISCVVLEGAAEAAYNIIGIRAWKSYAVFVSYFVARRLLLTLRSSVVVGKREFMLTLYMGEKSVTCLGLYDSGCLLTLPVTGEPVNIASPAIIRELMCKAEKSDCEQRLVPYSALGTDCGTLPVYRLDKIKIQRKKGEKILINPWVGQAQETLFGGKPYRVILNAGVIENE
jgi:hypothetical protein